MSVRRRNWRSWGVPAIVSLLWGLTSLPGVGLAQDAETGDEAATEAPDGGDPAPDPEDAGVAPEAVVDAGAGEADQDAADQGGAIVPEESELVADEDEAAAEEAELEAELQAQLDALSATDTPELDLAEPERLKIYGFLGFGTRYTYATDGAEPGTPVVFNNSIRSVGGWSFMPGNINLYFDAQPLERTRALIEMRLLFQGDDPNTPQQLVTVSDKLNPFQQGFTSLAAVALERAQIDQHIFDWLQVRAGLWLTPAGIWYEDHATPTLISMYLPQFVVVETIPMRQLGVQVFGGVQLGEWRAEYNTYLSNGRLFFGSQGGAPRPHSVFDLDNDKAFGYRLELSRSFPFHLALGHSFYYGTYEEVSRDVDSVLGPAIGKTLGWTEYTFALDASLDYDGLRLRAEALVQALRYDPGYELPLSTGGVAPDSNRYNGYILAAYRLPFEYLPVEPYVFWEIAHRPSRLGDTFVVGSLGFNAYLTEVSQLKFQWVSVAFFDHDSSPGLAWLGLPTNSNPRHTGEGRRFAVGTPGALSLRYVMTF